ncbi:hypothetical protein KKA24_00575, partial [Patescibacteria group bacterium]|nr:hypothetical protein [Patescibacteria group bacterium]
KKLLVRLKRGVYLLNANDRKINPSRAYIANQLYTPSYVSLEYALKFYDLIPERVSDLTGITTRKTLWLKNEAGTFIYQHIKPQAFRGFKALKDEAALTFFIAEPEKAVVDFFYLNLEKFEGADEEVFEESYRLQNVEMLKARKVMKFAELFDSGKLMRLSQSFCKFIKKEGGK